MRQPKPGDICEIPECTKPGTRLAEIPNRAVHEIGIFCVGHRAEVAHADIEPHERTELCPNCNCEFIV